MDIFERHAMQLRMALKSNGQSEADSEYLKAYKRRKQQKGDAKKQRQTIAPQNEMIIISTLQDVVKSDTKLLPFVGSLNGKWMKSSTTLIKKQNVYAISIRKSTKEMSEMKTKTHELSYESIKF